MYNTVFLARHGTYRFVEISFGLCNARRTNQRTKDLILFNSKWLFALFSLDDVEIFRKTPKQHIGHLRKVLLLRNSADAPLKLTK